MELVGVAFQRGDVLTGPTLQVLLAAVGSSSETAPVSPPASS